MQIGYIRVSKNDGSQMLDLQRDALLDAGVDQERIYEDLASGRKDDRPGLHTCMKALQPGNQRCWVFHDKYATIRGLRASIAGLQEVSISRESLSHLRN